MDIASIIGIIGALATVVSLILMGGSLSLFVDVHAIICVFGGATAATFIRFPLNAILHGFPSGFKLLMTNRKVHPRELVEEIGNLADLVRKSGPLALEGVNVPDPFLAKGIRFVADGYDAEFIRENMELERDLYLERLTEGEKIFRAMGDAAPAFGMVGTLIGMVQMFSNMSDPSKLGPAMAVALVATFYGAVVQNFIGLPIADKIKLKFHEEEIAMTLIIDGVMQLRESKSPALVREMLLAYLPEKQRAELAEAA